MYRGFSLKLNWFDKGFYDKGIDLYKSHKRQAQTTLEQFTNTNGSLNGSKMQSDWFGQIDADVFISHSHKDKDRAIALAGYLSSQYDLTVFIDSCIWDNANDLLLILDKEYCRIEGKNSYWYEERNRSTSHVHMILSSALSMMIDHTECLFFLNTPNSLLSKEVVDKTTSPWIYFEICMSQLIRKRSKEKHRQRRTENFSKSVNESQFPSVEYQLQLGHLVEINGDDLDKWHDEYFNSRPRSEYALDDLYYLHPIV